MRRALGLAAAAALLFAAPPSGADERSYPAGSLIIPMDRAYQSQGMYQAYGLLFQLLRQGVPVDWVIDPDKVWHGVRCDTVGNQCAWDCAEEGSGVKCPYPTASPDFYAATAVLWDDLGQTSSGSLIANHGYRGGPFVIDVAHRDRALPIIEAWNDQALWGSNDWAARSVFGVVTVHEATAPFTGYAKKQMLAAPTIAVFADGHEDIATAYLRAAGIKQSSGAEFPSGKCGANNCGPGTVNPDLLTVPSIMGDMGTCDAPNADHKNGALFTADGLPAYCQIMSMHWDVADRDKVQCGGGNCPATPEQCAGVPITYHGREVVAEVRSFLQYPVHFFAQCQAVNAYENTVPNPAWPYLDDEGRTGHFLTTTGTPPPCPCNPGPGEGTFQCVVDGCGPGMDCCLPKDAKEKGAGFLIAASPNPFQVLRPEVPYMQYDGVFAPEGGSEPAYNLSTYLGTQYKNDRDVTFITALDGPGKQDVWMTGYLDGACDIDEGPVVVSGKRSATSCGGKVSYLGGHSYAGKAGQRLFLNALFEADCVTAAGQPELAVSLTGELIVAAQSLPVEATYAATYSNTGNAHALDAVLRESVAGTGSEIIGAGGGGILSSEGAIWEIGAISGKASQPGDPPASGSRTSTLRFDEYGEHSITVGLGFRVGLSELEATPRTYTIRVMLDGDGDGVPDDCDPATFDPVRGVCHDPNGGGGGGGDGPDGGGGGGGSGDGNGSGGCGCRADASPGPAPFLGALMVAGFLAFRRRRRER